VWPLPPLPASGPPQPLQKSKNVQQGPERGAPISALSPVFPRPQAAKLAGVSGWGRNELSILGRRRENSPPEIIFVSAKIGVDPLTATAIWPKACRPHAAPLEWCPGWAPPAVPPSPGAPCPTNGTSTNAFVAGALSLPLLAYMFLAAHKSLRSYSPPGSEWWGSKRGSGNQNTPFFKKQEDAGPHGRGIGFYQRPPISRVGDDRRSEAAGLHPGVPKSGGLPGPAQGGTRFGSKLALFARSGFLEKPPHPKDSPRRARGAIFISRYPWLPWGALGAAPESPLCRAPLCA